MRYEKNPPSIWFCLAWLCLLALPLGSSFCPTNRRRTTNTNALVSSSSSSSSFRFASRTALAGVLEFVEPETGVTVRLVGSMHYNPESIRLTADTLQELQAERRLGSVLIESCPSRWNSTLQNDLPDFVTKLLVSEMRTAHDLALDFGRPVILGDQPIEVTIERGRARLGETARALVTPASWPALGANLTQAWSTAVPSGPQYLGAGALLDPKLVLAAPVSLFKYPLSYMVKDPLTAILVFGLLWGSDVASAAALGQPTTILDSTLQFFVEPSLWTYSLEDALVDLLGTALEIVLFGSLFLQVLLVERNQVLARNILEQCRYYQRSSPSPTSSRVQSAISLWSWVPFLDLVSGRKRDIPYAETSPRPSPTASNEAVIVAVLGMAHVNGVRKLLEERRVQES